MMNDCETKQDKQVPLELDRLATRISDLKEAIDELEKGLSLVLREPDPSCEATDAKDENQKCSLASTIAAYQRRVAGFAMSVRELTDRIEV